MCISQQRAIADLPESTAQQIRVSEQGIFRLRQVQHDVRRHSQAGIKNETITRVLPGSRAFTESARCLEKSRTFSNNPRRQFLSSWESFVGIFKVFQFSPSEMLQLLISCPSCPGVLLRLALFSLLLQHHGYSSFSHFQAEMKYHGCVDSQDRQSFPFQSNENNTVVN